MYPKIVKYIIFHPQATYTTTGCFRIDSYEELELKKIALMQAHQVHGKPVNELGYKFKYKTIDVVKLVRKINNAIHKSNSAKRTQLQKIQKSKKQTPRMRPLPAVYRARINTPTGG